MLLSITLCLTFGGSVFSLDLPPIYAKILNELSWTLKLNLLKDFMAPIATTRRTTTTIKTGRRVGLEALMMAEPELDGNLLRNEKKINEKSIYISNTLAEKDPSEYLRDDSNYNAMIFDNKDSTIVSIAKSLENDSKRDSLQEEYDLRRFNVYTNKKSHLIKSRKNPEYRFRNHESGRYILNNSPQMGRRQDMSKAASATDSPDDENNMRMKLFRLMYETVRDSDLKVKRAELIKTHYHNSSAFDIGYLMGDITDKYNIMHDIATTLERLYHEWKPLEHINAYEQIANQAIQISHLIDMVRHINKRGNSTV